MTELKGWRVSAKSDVCLPPQDNGPPVLLVKDWTEVPGMLDELLADPAALDARQAEIKTW